MSLVAANPASAVRAPANLFAPIQSDLEAVEQLLMQTIGSRRTCLGPIIRHLESYCGKRLRPALLLLTARACGRITHDHRILGAVVEMIHTATLVHDDVLDEADVRRHAATVNAGWGNSASILLGDYLFTHAFHLASSVDARACRLIGEATNRVCEGELHQTVERDNWALSERDYLDIVESKTAELTSCCARLGALYSGADMETVESLARYGRWLGIAFQIADDLLDLVGEERVTGKSLGTDLEQRKPTLPLIHLLEKSPKETVSRLHQILSSPGNHKREVLEPFLVESGSLRYAGRKAEDYAAKARAELSCLPPSECKSILETLTDRVVHRSY
jgi:octaprenyl-diphosphate synthase